MLRKEVSFLTVLQLVVGVGISVGWPLVAQDEVEESLSVSFQSSKVRALLFPGQSTKLQMEVGVHPEEKSSWDDVQMRIAAKQPTDRENSVSYPVRITATHAATKRTTNVNIGEWVYVSSLGLTQSRRTLSLTVHFSQAWDAPFEMVGEIDSAKATRASTAPFEVRCADLKIVDIRDPVNPEDDVTIGNGDTAWIAQDEVGGRSIPLMPRLISEVTGLPTDYTVHWKLQNSYGRRRPFDDLQIPSDGWRKLSGDSAWKAFGAYHEQFFGGNAKLSCKVEETSSKEIVYQSSRQFKILSKNPSDEGAKAYIERTRGKFWFAEAIARHESRQGRRIYNQFNSFGRVEDEPNYGPPDGWGLFQIDSARGADVDTHEVWDWRQNVHSAYQEFRQAIRDTHLYSEAIKEPTRRNGKTIRRAIPPKVVRQH